MVPAMAIWKDHTPAKKDSIPMPMDPQPPREADVRAEPAASYSAPSRAQERPSGQQNPGKESLIAASLVFEGKIQGAGDIRIAGQFKGDIDVQGDLTIETGAKLTGSVRAGKVVIAGELEGNIVAAARVELLDTGMLNGDLKAGSLTVAAGSRMRGQFECGWDDRVGSKAVKMENGSGS
jgi:cytoskeletal protein CcmA (bactofilin family)